tara:strand:+ start:532 stop:960 length:429 start_codon:yes stop_codon:yes gene_type:complete
MTHFRIEPNIGVGPIKFGMTKAEVASVFGLPEFENGNRVGYFSGFMINFDAVNVVEFIELAKSDLFTSEYKGVDLQNLLASKVLSFVSENDSFDENDPELGHSYVFKSLQLSFWRGTLPEDENDNDGQFFEAIGIGCSHYFE